ncbi:unnamed protein product [Arctia plantaginis]|uniref:dolichyl-P-Man:Man5GlcNAc2-PP-dolichol alpha-1,3-mannosyltransferase n=1 Tax=Arctia plantaginis TaxID=874455 RepID=A0A8S0ZDD3_ARCPL|nr:unnamed protein product [Arctia plantaginis]
MGGRNKLQDLFRELPKMFTWSYLKDLIINPKRLPFVSLLIIIAELIINLLVVERVPYTEIDWKAYMQECEGFLNGTFDYSQLRGDTGPLVYPAGFVYIYSFFYFLTSRGENIKLAQYIFIIDAKNLENKRKYKLKKDMKHKLNKKGEEEETLTREQEDFLNSFETMLQKSSDKSKKSAKKTIAEPIEDSNYKIDFVRFLILALIEMCWNTYPSTEVSSALLHACHICVLFGVYRKLSAELKIVTKIE